MPGFPLDRYLSIRTATGPSFAPDGRSLAFLTNMTGVAQAWAVSVEGGWPTQLTFSSESVRSVRFSPVRHELLFAMDTGGNERTQLYRLHGSGDHGLGDGWKIDDLTRAPQAVHQFGGWSHDGTRIAFAANRDDAARFDLYVLKLGDVSPRLVQRGPGGYYTPLAWAPDDRHLLTIRTESNFKQDLYLVDVATGKARLLTENRKEVQYRSPVFSPDGKRLYCATTGPAGADRTFLAAIDVASGATVALDEPPHEVEDVAASPKGKWLAWTTNVDGQSRLHLTEAAAKGKWKPLVCDLPLGVVNDLTFAPDDSRLAFTFDGPRHNPDVWVWDLAPKPAASPRPVTRASRAGLPFAEFAVPEKVLYRTFDGRMIPAWFSKPAMNAGELPPVIVYPHGGPESQTRPAFSALFQYFVAAGYGVFAPNVRGSSGYGTAYMNLDNTTKRMDSVADLIHAAYWLRDEKQADPKRLAVYGGSYGGFMVLAAVTTAPDLWAAGIDVVGICNFVTFLEKTGAYRRAHREQEYGSLTEHRAFLEKISPLRHVDRIKCPMMVIHGANDPRVPIDEAEQIVAALRRRNVPVEYLRYEDEGHGLAKLKNRLDAYPKMVAFLDKYVKGAGRS